MIKEKLKSREIGIEKNQDISEKLARKSRVLLALGANLNSKFGNRIETLEIAQTYLINNGIKIIKKSCYYESLAYPNTSNPKFINCVLSITTDLGPIKLMDVIINIEKKIGRVRNKKNEPRVCDIDIIDYKNEIIKMYYNNSNLIIPHEKIQDRNFVLIPLKEIEPLWIHPETNLNIETLINNFNINNINSITKI